MGEDGRFRYVAKVKRFLRGQTTTGGDRHGTPRRSLNNAFPYGIKLLYSPENGTVDIVFIHGLTGDRERTWTARNAVEPWPKTLLPSVLPTARILTYGYDSYVTDWQRIVSQNRIANHAWNLLTSLATYRENENTNERPIIFICHSLGGLVCEDALVTSKERPEPHLQNIIRCTRGILFLGTPHHGAGLARWAEHMSRSIGVGKQANSKIIEALRRDSEVLARIQDSFHTMIKARATESLPQIEISCFYEELPLLGVGLVVPQDSAILPGYIPIGIHRNHRDMTKFEGPDDPGFVAVCGELRRWTGDMNSVQRQPLLESQSSPLPDFDLDEQPGTAIMHGDHNRQYNASGPAVQKNVDGNYFEAKGDQNFGPVVKHQYIHQTTIGEVHIPHHIISLARNEDVVDRAAIFETLEAYLPHTSMQYQTAALHGLGGSGKTQVALEYAYRRGESSSDTPCSVFWVNADNEITFAADYKTIAKALRVPANLDGEDLLVAVRERIETEPRWLLVLDNADNLRLFYATPSSETAPPVQTEEPTGESKLATLYDYVPRCGSGTVLWTSRDERIVGSLVSPRRGIKIDRMSGDEAMKLLENWMTIRLEDVHDTETLLEELQWLPLAISQAGAYMRTISMPIRKYLSRLAEERTRWHVLGKEAPDRHRRPGVPNSVLRTWSISIERLKVDSVTAYTILQTIAYISNQDIPFTILEAAARFSNEDRSQQTSESWEDEDRIWEAVTRLKDLSFLKEHRENEDHSENESRAYEIHKLVQEATRYGLSMEEFEGGEYFSSIALQIMGELFPERKRENWEECERYIAHAIQVCEWVEICGKKVEVADLLTRVSGYLYDRGRWKEREPVDERVWRLRRQILGETHPDTIWSMVELAATYHNQGQYAKAKPMFIKALGLRQQILGEMHPDTIRSMVDLAATYRAQGRYTKAEPIVIKALGLCQRTLGEMHPDTIRSMADLAATYRAQGQYTEAELMFVKALGLRQQTLGEMHPNTIRSMADLAATYRAQGRYAEAEPMFVKALRLHQQTLGEMHPDTIRSIADLAATYHAQGRYTEAEPMFVKALGLCQQILGEIHPDTIRNIADLAATYYTQGQYAEAEPMFVKALGLRQQILGEIHPDTIRSIADLAATYYAQGRYAEAELMFVKALGLRQQILGETHPSTLQAMYDLAITWSSRGRRNDSVDLMEECLRRRRSVLGSQHPFTIQTDTILCRWKNS